jgi:hypothetical protein
VVLGIYFVVHCTPIADTLTKNSGARQWIGITPLIEVIAGVLLGIGLAVTIFVLAKVRPPARTPQRYRQGKEWFIRAGKEKGVYVLATHTYD